MHRRYHIIYTLLCVIALSITACGAKSQDYAENTPVAMSYSPQYSQYEYTFDAAKEVYSDFYGIFVQGDKLYCISRDKNNKDTLNIIDISTGEHSDRLLGRAAVYFRTVNGFAGFGSDKITLYDSNFENTGEVDLKNFIAERKAENGFFSYDSIAVDADGNIGVISRNKLYVLDANGVLLSEAECPDGVADMKMTFADNEGNWYVLCDGAGGNGKALYSLDIKSGAMEQRVGSIMQGEMNSVVAVCPVGNNDFYIFTNNYVYRYSAKSSSLEELICLRDYGVEIGNEGRLNGVSKGFGVLEDGTPGIIVMTDSSEKDGLDVKGVELVTLVPSVGSGTERTELIAATIFEPTYKEREAVMRFNKYNPDYYITFKVYRDENYNTDDIQEVYRLAQQSFNNDLVSGKGADIFFAGRGELDFENLGAKGALVDLYEFIDADDDINRDDFVQSILRTMEYDGKLYAVSPDFSLITIVGKKSLLGQYDKWDFDALYDLVEKYPDSVLFMNGSQEGNFEKFISYSLDMFYDSGNSECSFDSEQFVKLLELAKNGKTEYDTSADRGELLTSEKVLLYQTGIISWYDMQVLPYYFGEDIAYVGYPSAGDSGTALRYYYQWAVSGQSQHKDGAWQFIKSLFADEYQRSCWYFPVAKASFEGMIADAMNFDENFGYSLSSGVDIKIHAMTEEEADEFRDLVDNAELFYRYNDTVKDIVTEEAQYYFSGARSAEETVAVIQNRVKLYLEEKN